MRLFYIILIFLTNTLLAQKSNNYDILFTKIENNLLSYDSHLALKKIDSILVADFNKLTSEENTAFKILKIEALAKSNLFTKSLQLSDKLLKELDLSNEGKVRILLNNAVAYEYVGNFLEAKKKLDETEKIFDTKDIIKDKQYARYLYRKASYYRVQQKYDELSFSYAEKAKEFSIKNNYKSESAVASMILGFLEAKKHPKIAEKHFNLGLSFWKEVDDTHGMAGMYLALSDIEKRRKNYNKALHLCNLAINSEKNSTRYGGLSYAYHKKGRLFEQKKKLDSALFYLKKKNIYKDKDNLLQQEITVNELIYESDIEKAKLNNVKLQKSIKAEKKRFTYLLIFSLVLIILGLSFMILSYRIKLKNKKINKQKELLDQSVKQKNILLKELHHRVKNNLAMIISLIKLQENKLDDKDKIILQNLEHRIETIAIAHNQFLYSEDNTKHSLDKYIDTIAQQLLNISPRSVKINKDIDNIEVSLDSALPMGIIINELITNSLKYAKSNHQLIIDLTIKLINDKFMMTYSDNGSELAESSEKNSSSLGLMIIKAMVKQLKGTYTKENFNYKFVLHLKNE